MGEGILTEIAKAVGTPVFVYDAERIRSQVVALRDAFRASNVEIHYSVKANSNLSILKLLREMGTGADIVSIGELHRTIAAGFDPAQVVFSGVGKRRDELEDAIKLGVGLVNIETEGELEFIKGTVESVERPIRLGIRVNPDVTADTHPYTQTGSKAMKFGVPFDEVGALAAKIADSKNLELVSIAMHIGSQIADPKPYQEGAQRLAVLIGSLKEQGIDTLETVDVGGGIGVQYYDDEKALDLKAFAEAVQPLAQETGLKLAIEPGRVIVGNAGVMLTNVLYRKRAGGRSYVIVDAGMNDFGRPSYYGAQHRIRVVRPSACESEEGELVDVVGPICESGDYQGLQRKLSGAGVGALLAVEGAGAYGFSMGSNYNSRPRPAEVMVDGEKFAIVRQREKTENLWKDELLEKDWVEVK